MLTAAYHVLEQGTLYQDLGADHIDRSAKARKPSASSPAFANLGYAVEITPAAHDATCACVSF
jgi:hypothetical protein